jgi:DnaJ-class molecular chaperone
LTVDPHQVLGVSTDASDEEIRDAFRKLVFRYHPDVNQGGETDTHRLHTILIAYKALKENASRQTIEHEIWSEQSQRKSHYRGRPANRFQRVSQRRKEFLIGVILSLVVCASFIVYVWTNYQTDWIPWCC